MDTAHQKRAGRRQNEPAHWTERAASCHRPNCQWYLDFGAQEILIEVLKRKYLILKLIDRFKDVVYIIKSLRNKS